MSKNGYQKDFFGTSFSYPIATWVGRFFAEPLIETLTKI